MIRIVSTNNSGVYIDPYFEKNYNGAKAAGIPVGAYIYTYAKTEERQNQEILLAMDALNGKTLEYPLALDVEDSSLTSMGKAALSALVQRGLVIIDQKGYVPILYTYTNYTRIWICPCLMGMICGLLTIVDIMVMVRLLCGSIQALVR